MRITVEILFAIVVTSILSCGGKTGDKTSIRQKKKTDCVPYFDFDNVEHYFLDINEDSAWKISLEKTKKEKLKREILTQRKFYKISDSSLFENMESLDFVKNVVPNNNYEALNEIFCQTQNENSTTLSCLAVYRDILVFKKRNKTIGLAKICFSCSESIIFGTTVNSDDFRQPGDFKRLYNLLHK